MSSLILPTFSSSRRKFINFIGGSAAGISSPGITQIIAPQPAPQSGQVQTWQSDPLFWQKPRSLWLKRKSNGEEIRVYYYADGHLLSDGYNAACNLLRDIQANKSIPIDPVLLDVLCGIQGWFALAGIYRPIIILSGYRTPGTNNNTENAAKDSMHLHGRAADIYVEGIPIEYMQQLAIYLRGGGVGVYFDKGFIHIDTGRLRSWKGN